VAFRGTPVNNRGGWYFPSKLPLLEAEAAERSCALKAVEPLGFLRAVVHNISHDGAKTGLIKRYSTFEAHCRRTL
jgi:hypothetical protein